MFIKKHPKIIRHKMSGRNIASRSPAAQSPLLRKGGPHAKSKTGQRVRDRLSTNSAIDDWMEELEDDNYNQEENGERKLPVFLSMIQSPLR